MILPFFAIFLKETRVSKRVVGQGSGVAGTDSAW
jgi:hypothetical protein